MLAGKKISCGECLAVNIAQKGIVDRKATAEGSLYLQKETIERIREGRVQKGDVVSSARLAAIHAVKQTPLMLLYCHPIPILGVEVTLQVNVENVHMVVSVQTKAQTGCEMEALAGVTNGLLMVWDMVKMYEKDPEGQYPSTALGDIRVVEKRKEEN